MEYELSPEIVSVVARAAKAAGLVPDASMSEQERLILNVAWQAEDDSPENLRDPILCGLDPLGESYSAIKGRQIRRREGIFYTPADLVNPMVNWVLSRTPARLVDAGCGTGRFSIDAAKKRADIKIVAVDTDPVATILCRSNLQVLGIRNVEVRHAEFTALQLDEIDGRTAYVGNPPYVRHHELSMEQKRWISKAGEILGHKISKLSGLHAYFFYSTALKARPGDVGCFLTSAEWLDNNYGLGMRQLLVNGLGVESLHLFDTEAFPFREAMSTAVITCFEVAASRMATRYRVVQSARDLESLDAGAEIWRTDLSKAEKWGRAIRDGFRGRDRGLIRLGEIASVHRGAVTGANHFFAMSKTRAMQLGLMPFVKPVIASAQEVLGSRGTIRAADVENVVLDLPRDLDLGHKSSEPVLTYLKMGEAASVHNGYICSRRRPWWSIGFREAPPIVATYMARQAPAFALNPEGIRILNIAHGIFPRKQLSQRELTRLVERLNSERQSFGWQGRVYQGGLQKFEPGEMEDLLLKPISANGKG